MRLRHKVKLYAYRDIGNGCVSAREFSEPAVCMADITPRSAKRTIDNRAAFGKENVVSHNVVMRYREDIDNFTYLNYGNDWYKIQDALPDDRKRFMSMGAIFKQGGVEIEALEEPVDASKNNYVTGMIR